MTEFRSEVLCLLVGRPMLAPVGLTLSLLSSGFALPFNVGKPLLFCVSFALGVGNGLFAYTKLLLISRIQPCELGQNGIGTHHLSRYRIAARKFRAIFWR